MASRLLMPSVSQKVPHKPEEDHLRCTLFLVVADSDCGTHTKGYMLKFRKPFEYTKIPGNPVTVTHYLKMHSVTAVPYP